MFGEHGVGKESSVRQKLAFANDALPFAEKVRQDARVGNSHGVDEIRDLEGDGGAGLLDRALLDHAAKANAGARLDMLLRHFAGAIEKRDAAAGRIKNETDGNAQDGQPGQNKYGATIFARHLGRTPGAMIWQQV